MKRAVTAALAAIVFGSAWQPPRGPIRSRCRKTRRYRPLAVRRDCYSRRKILGAHGTERRRHRPGRSGRPEYRASHLLIDTDLPTALDQPIPNDKNHLHFGGGQTEARLELPPGRHTLQLLLGDSQHVPTNPPLYSKKMTIIVPP